MRVQWRAKALADIRGIHKWLSTIDGALPNRTLLRIRAAANILPRLGDVGRPSRVAGELSVPGAPYVIAYNVTGDVFDIMASITRVSSGDGYPPDP